MCNPLPFLIELEKRWEEGDKGSGVMHRVLWYLVHLLVGIGEFEVRRTFSSYESLRDEFNDAPDTVLLVALTSVLVRRLHPGMEVYDCGKEYATLETEWKNEKY